jgi:hypothetical protein
MLLRAALCHAGDRRYAVEKLSVELLPLPGVGLTERALLDGAVEVLWAGPMRAHEASRREPNSVLACLAEVVCRDPFSIVGQYPNPGFRLADPSQMATATVSECPHPGRACRRICGRQASTGAATPEMAETIPSFFPALDRAVLAAALARNQAQSVWRASRCFPKMA